jgi:thymidylate kinase
VARRQDPGHDPDGAVPALRVAGAPDTAQLLQTIGERFGDAVVLWRGDDLSGSDVDLLAQDEIADQLAALLFDTGLTPAPAEPGHVVWSGAGLPVDVLRASSWPPWYPALAGVLARAVRDGPGPPVASREDRLLMLAAEAVNGRPLGKVARRARALLDGPGAARRLADLAGSEGERSLGRLVADPDRLAAAARRDRLPYPRALAVAVRSRAARAVLAARLAARLRRAHGRQGATAHRSPMPRAQRPLLITVSGMDGAGKSTVVEAIARHLQRSGLPAEVAWARLGSEGELLNRLALPVKRALRRQGTIADPVAAGGPSVTRVQDAREASGRRRPLSWLWILLVAIVNARSYRHSALARRAGVNIVCDRWAIDAVVDLELRYGEHRAARAALRRLPPRPDLTLLLSLDAATAAARKPGDQAERVLREMERLYAARAAEDAIAVVDATAPRDRVRERVLALVDRAVASGQPPTQTR